MPEDTDYTALCSSKTLQSESRGFFLDFADHVTQTVGSDWMTKLQSDEARIQACWELGSCVHDVLQNVQELYRGKCGQTSTTKRHEAERCLNAGDPKRALALYNHAVIRAPPTGLDKNVDNGLSLALALAARSEALLQLEHHEASLADIQLAIKENFPLKLRYQLYWRMGRCYRGMGQIPKARVSMQLAIKLLTDQKDNMDGLEMVVMSTRLHNELSQLELEQVTLQIQGSSPPVTSLPSVSHGANPLMPTASNHITVQSSPQQGRYAVATDHIATGDTVVVEAPYAACLLPDKFGSHCHHCFKRLLAPVACSDCSGVAFCSVACRDTAANSYHQYECHYMDLLLGSGMSILCHLALRMITQSNVQFFRNLHPSLQDSSQQPESYVRVYNLVTHADKRPPDDFVHRTLMAVFLLRVLQHANFFTNTCSKGKSLTSDELLIGSLLLRHLQLLQFNAHEIFETCLEAPNKFRGSKTVYLAVGIYPTVALFNHDCHPALARYFVEKNIVLQALRPLDAGETVAENYGPIFTKRPLAFRQRTLLSRYWFKCECQACKEDWPTYETLSSDTFRLRCPTKGCTQLSKKNNRRCPKCKKQVSLEEGIVQAMAEKFTEGMDAMEAGRVEEAAELFCVYLDTMYRVGSHPCRDLSLCQDALRGCLSVRGNTWVAQ